MSLVWVCTYSEKTENAWWPGLLLKNIVSKADGTNANNPQLQQVEPPQAIKQALESCTFGFNRKVNDFEEGQFAQVFLLVDGRIGLLPLGAICEWEVKKEGLIIL